MSHRILYRLACCLPFVLLFRFPVVAQVQLPDEVERNTLQPPLGNEQTVTQLLELGFSYLNHQHLPESADSCAKRAILLAEELEFEAGLGQAYFLRGRILWLNDQFDSALLYVQLSQALFEEQQDDLWIYRSKTMEGTIWADMGEKQKGIALLNEAIAGLRLLDAPKYLGHALNNLASMFHNRGEYVKAIDLLREAASLMEQVGETESLGSIYNNIGSAYLTSGAIEAAGEYFEKSFSFFEAHQHEVKMAGSLLNLGNLKRIQHAYEAGLKDFREADRLLAKHHQTLDQANARYNISLLFYSQGRYDSARHYLDLAIPVFASFQQTNFFIRSQYLHGKLLVEEGQYPRALKSAKQGLALAEEKELLAYQQVFWGLIADIHKAMGNYRLSLEAVESHLTIQDSIKAHEQEETLLRLKSDDEQRQKGQEIEQLNELVKLREIVVQEQREVIAYQFIGLVLFLGLCFLLFFYYRQKRELSVRLEETVSIRTRELENSNRSLLESSQELNSFTRSTSHDLKEPLRNTISFLGLLEKSQGEETPQNQKEYLRFAQMGSQQMAHVLQNVFAFSIIRDRVYQESQVAVSDLIGELQSDLSLLKGQVLLREVPPLETDPVFLKSILLKSILKQLLVNALTYNDSGDKQVEISYQKGATSHQIILQDNGIGIPDAYQAQIFEMFTRLHDRGKYKGSGLGLAIASRAARKLGGEILLRESSPAGSTFVLHLPL